MDDEYPFPETNQFSLSPGAAWGLGALLIGCSLLISACVLMVFNVILFNIGFRGIPKELAQIGGSIGAVSVSILGICSVWWGYRGWSAAVRREESTALGVAGTVAAVFGLVAWLIAALDLLAILQVIPI
jgi:hypothetical protein